MSNFSLLLCSLREEEMNVFGRNYINFVMLFCFVFLCLFTSFVDCSRDFPSKLNEINKDDDQYSPLELTPKLSIQIKIHAFLLWGSVGFLMPIGILVIRLANFSTCSKNFNIFFYLHVILQILAVILAIIGVILSIKNFDNSFNNMHQRIGLGLYGLILFQPLLGFLRPKRGMRLRSIWYFFHWLIGIGICIIGIANIYIGLYTYHKRTTKSVKLWIILFTIEISLIGFAYLLQDKWSYMLKQGARLGDEQIRPTDNIISPSKEHEIIS